MVNGISKAYLWRSNQFVTSAMIMTFLIAELVDVSKGFEQSRGHPSRSQMGVELYSAQPQMAQEHSITNVTTQIGSHAFLPCQVNTPNT